MMHRFQWELNTIEWGQKDIIECNHLNMYVCVCVCFKILGKLQHYQEVKKTPNKSKQINQLQQIKKKN